MKPEDVNPILYNYQAEHMPPKKDQESLPNTKVRTPHPIHPFHPFKHAKSSTVVSQHIPRDKNSSSHAE
jgi:hypothetical protein